MSSYTCIYQPDFVNLYYIFMMMFETSKRVPRTEKCCCVFKDNYSLFATFPRFL